MRKQNKHNKENCQKRATAVITISQSQSEQKQINILQSSKKKNQKKNLYQI